MAADYEKKITSLFKPTMCITTKNFLNTSKQ